MAVVVTLDDVLHDRRMTLTALADRIGITLANLSILKTGKARDPLFDARCDLRGARVSAWRHLRFETAPAEDKQPTPAGRRGASR